MGVPALRQFALTRSRFGSNVKTLTEDKPPIIDMSNKGLAEASDLSLDPESYVRGSVLDLLGDPGLAEISVLERSVQLEIKILRAAIAAGKGSRLYNIINPKGGEDITQIQANGGDIALAYQYLAREEILEENRRLKSTIDERRKEHGRLIRSIAECNSCIHFGKSMDDYPCNTCCIPRPFMSGCGYKFNQKFEKKFTGEKR